MAHHGLNWYQDFISGVRQVRILFRLMPEQVFSELQRLRLTARLTRINRKRFDLYLRLGQRVIDGQTGSAPPASEDDLKQIYQQIELVLEEQKQVKDEIEELREYGHIRRN